MKRRMKELKAKIFYMALAMVLSFSLMMAVPVAAVDDVVFSNYSEESGDYDVWNDTSPSTEMIEEFTTNPDGQWDITGIRLSVYAGIFGGGIADVTISIYADDAGTSVVKAWDTVFEGLYSGDDFSLDVSGAGVTLDASTIYWLGLRSRDGTIGWERTTGDPYSHVFELTGSPATEPTPTPTPDGEGGCFIATAAYGTKSAEEIDVLRAFRDEVLMESQVGSQLVEWYYQTSPPVADFISGNSLLRTIVRELVIDPIVSIATFTQGMWGK